VVTWLLSFGFALAGALALAALALRLIRARLTRARPAHRRDVLLLVAAATLFTVSALPSLPLPLVLLAPAALCVAATAVALASAAYGLRETYVDHAGRILELADDLRAARSRIAALEEEQRERLHEARTAMLGLLGATHLFAVPSEGGESADSAAQLQRVVTAEARRLTSLLDPESDEAPREFSLATAFEPVFLAYRATGMRIDAELRGLRAHGRPTATATVLANLLSNAAKYAPGSPVVVRAASAGASVRICVEDDGPGIPAEERRVVLSRGERLSRSAAPGSGIGLYTSAVAMAEQGGSLRIEGRGGLNGTCVVLSLPAAVIQPVGPLRANAS
jgi:signal transduction histidine kinase